jgi:hypothetical protein
MDNHIGIAFTPDAITTSCFKKSPEEHILTGLSKISYPFPYDESNFLKEENIVRLANLLLNHFESSHIDVSSASISVESNLSLAKMVKIPFNLNEQEEEKHIQWDLQQSLASDLDEYVYLKSETTFAWESFKEILVIALRKDIIDFFKSLANFAKINLNNLSSNQLAAEVCFKNAYSEKSDNLNLLYRITNNRLESICLLDGNLYMSNYEKINSASPRSLNEIILDRITDYAKYVEENFEYVKDSTTKINQIFIYGMELTDHFKSLLNNNITIPFLTFDPISNLKLSPELKTSLNTIKNVADFVECIGVALDAD